MILTERRLPQLQDPRLPPELEERMRRRLAAKMDLLMLAALQPALPPAPTVLQLIKPRRPATALQVVMTVAS